MTYPVFATGDVLPASDMNAIGLWKISPTAVSGTGVSNSSGNITFSASTEIILDGIFSADYRQYLIMWDAQTSAGGGTVNLQFRDSTNATVATNYNRQTIDATGATLTSSASTAQTSMRVGANDASGYNALELKIFAPNVALPTRVIATYVRNNGANSEQNFGAQTGSTVMNGIRLSVSSGNMTGSMFVYGMRA